MDLDFNVLFNDLKSYDFDDLKEIRKALARYGLVLNNVIKEYDKLLDILHDIIQYAERKRFDKNYLKVGVYEVYKNRKTNVYYHIVSDTNYEFKNIINGSWKLKNVFELDTPRPIRINRFVIDFDYWVLNNI